jgi:hypothetical protein
VHQNVLGSEVFTPLTHRQGLLSNLLSDKCSCPRCRDEVRNPCGFVHSTRTLVMMMLQSHVAWQVSPQQQMSYMQQSQMPKLYRHSNACACAV